MGLRDKQSEFTLATGKLILRAYELGYELTYGDTYPCKTRPKTSFHWKGLAVDFHLFRDGEYLKETEDHEPLGLYWESLGGTWGGRFGEADGNHYSWGER